MYKQQGTAHNLQGDSCKKKDPIQEKCAILGYKMNKIFYRFLIGRSVYMWRTAWTLAHLEIELGSTLVVFQFYFTIGFQMFIALMTCDRFQNVVLITNYPTSDLMSSEKVWSLQGLP